MIRTLTPESAALERRQILADVRFHRNVAARRLRDLDRLEADCQRVGIRLIRQPVRAQEEQTRGRPDPDDR